MGLGLGRELVRLCRWLFSSFSLSSELASGWELNNQTKHFLGCCLCCETSTDDVDDARGNRHIRQGQGDK